MADKDKKRPPKQEVLPPENQQPVALPRPKSVFFGRAVAKQAADVAEHGAREADAKVRVAKAGNEFRTEIERSKYVPESVRQEQELSQQDKRRQIDEQKHQIAQLKRKTDEERRLGEKQKAAANKQSLTQQEVANEQLQKARSGRFTAQSKAAIDEAVFQKTAELARAIAEKKVNAEYINGIKDELKNLKDVATLQRDIGQINAEANEAKASANTSSDDVVSTLMRHVAGRGSGLSEDEKTFIKLITEWTVEFLRDGEDVPTTANEWKIEAQGRHKAAEIDESSLYSVENVVRDLKDATE